MKKNEIIELGGVEYTLELNRDSYLKIDQYCNIGKTMMIMNKTPYDYIENITEETDPFADSISEEDLERDAKEKEEKLFKMIEVALWIWLYPNHKFPMSKIKEIVKPYLEDLEKAEEIGTLVGKYLNECIEIRQAYNEEQKNLKALANKN